MTVKVPEFLPEPIVTDVGSVAEPELLDSLTSIPEAGAGPLSFIAPVVDVPPLTRVGIIVMEVIAGGLTVRLTVLDTEPNFAVIVTADWTLTPMVGTLNVAEALPDAILMDLGTVAEVPLLESETTTPPLPAGPFKTTVPVELAPPKTIDGVTDTIANIGVVSVDECHGIVTALVKIGEAAGAAGQCSQNRVAAARSGNGCGSRGVIEKIAVAVRNRGG